MRLKVYVIANLYIPKKIKEPSATVLFQVGQEERLNYYEPFLGKAMIPATISDHQYAGEQYVLNGDSIASCFIADAMRTVDYLQSCKEVAKTKIGATGL